ncbi:MAG TPA: GNAT family N-acyltransferase [Candidatus Bathyarchaeia archaeon]|nr:GNAT family N-acyltransferase [Candidatus Bathyarchaeia archaeon]
MARPYHLRFAASCEDRAAAFRLRFLVFNLELGKGLESAYRDGLDTDQFDSTCDHLIVEHRATGQVVGTYRVQTGKTAARGLGFYSAREFDLSPYESLRGQLVELGRAAIHKDHRSFEVLTLLWRGIALYATERGGRYLIGCCSLTSQNQAEAVALYRSLDKFLVGPEMRTSPHVNFGFSIDVDTEGANARSPKLLRAYLSIGAEICGPPAIDREFKTIDFLTFLDLHKLSGPARARFLL